MIRPGDEAKPLEAIQARHRKPKKPVKYPYRLVPFDELRPGTKSSYLIDGVIPRAGLVAAWGPPKCGKSFWVFDLVLHIALRWSYRGRRVNGGPVCYMAFEGAEGFKARAEAFRRTHAITGKIPLFLIASNAKLVRDHQALIASINGQMDAPPVVVVLDTLNRSIDGSESKDADMGAYLAAAETIHQEFDCAVLIVHHCGVDGTRPRGHTSLTGAVDSQIAVKRDGANHIVAEVEAAKDFAEGARFVSALKVIEVGTDDDGQSMTSCIIVPVDGDGGVKQPPKLSDSDLLALDALRRAMGKHAVKPIPQSGTFWVCPVEAWREHFYAVKDGDRDTKRKAFQRARERLQLRAIIATWEDSAWLTGHAGHGGTFAGHVPQDWSGTDKGPSLREGPNVPLSRPGTAVPAFRVIGPAPVGTVCVHCHRADDGVKKIKAAIVGAKAEPLHEDCAPHWFTAAQPSQFHPSPSAGDEDDDIPF